MNFIMVRLMVHAAGEVLVHTDHRLNESIDRIYGRRQRPHGSKG
jgi:hypothetical protein